MVSPRIVLFVFFVLPLGGSTDLAAQQSQPVGVQNSRDSTVVEEHPQPDFACAARRTAIVGGGALVGMAVGRVVYAVGNLLSSDHGSLYQRGQHHWEVGGAIVGGSLNALVLVAVTCEQLATPSETFRRPPARAGFGERR